MDAGIAALLGAALGSLTTLGAAVVNGRAQARTQFAQWRRQHRRDAYAAYLGALHERDIAMDTVLEALRADAPDLVRDAHAADAGRKTEDEAAARERERRLYEQVKEVRAKARDVLAGTD
jgi:uncharacterized heparinase superfamily protein